MFPTLRLPKRFEALEQQATENEYDLTAVVQRIDSAAARVEILLRQVDEGGLGRFELFLGKSGVGKTTFFKTLTKFFTGTSVLSVPNTIPLSDVPGYIEARSSAHRGRQVWVMYDRDNETVSDQDAFTFSEQLRVLFRKTAGKVVVSWPLTDEKSARLLAKTAWEVGRDSIVDVSSKGLYEFQGPPKDTFIKIADLTTRSLKGDGLEAFGLDEETLNSLVAESETIAEFYSRLEQKSSEITGRYRDILKDKTIPSVWVLVAGDDSRALNLTVATLTQGVKKYVDVDRVTNYLDDPASDALYLSEWKKRRSQVAFLMRLLDVRIFELPPNVALACVREYDDDELKSPLKLKKNSANLIDLMERTPFFRALLDEDSTHAAYSRKTEDETKHEFIRVQLQARTADKKLNKALASAVSDALLVNGVVAKLSAEKQDSEGLKPDIRIEFENGRTVCLEPTWRSTGDAVPTEIPKRQSTLTVGHIQMYVLEKVLSYVDAMDL